MSNPHCLNHYCRSSLAAGIGEEVARFFYVMNTPQTLVRVQVLLQYGPPEFLHSWRRTPWSYILKGVSGLGRVSWSR